MSWFKRKDKKGEEYDVLENLNRALILTAIPTLFTASALIIAMTIDIILYDGYGININFDPLCNFLCSLMCSFVTIFLCAFIAFKDKLTVKVELVALIPLTVIWWFILVEIWW